MSNIWFTADLHFNHKIVLRGRGFIGVSEHDQFLINQWNSVVQRKDSVYVLGDFCLGLDQKYFLSVVRELSGNIHLIIGNHDQLALKAHRRHNVFCWAKDTYLLKAQEHSFWLSHYAHRVWPLSHYGSMHLYGHSHGNLEGHGRSMDVGVDCCGMRPIHIDEIIDTLVNKDII